MTIMLTLPKPPSVNACFANVPKKGRVKTPAYTAWIAHAGLVLSRQRPRIVPGEYALDIFTGPVRGDPDNLIKPVSDILVAHGVMEDDKHARRAAIEVVETIPVGQIQCIVRPWHEVGRLADQFAFPEQRETRR